MKRAKHKTEYTPSEREVELSTLVHHNSSTERFATSTQHIKLPTGSLSLSARLSWSSSSIQKKNIHHTTTVTVSLQHNSELKLTPC